MKTAPIAKSIITSRKPFKMEIVYDTEDTCFLLQVSEPELNDWCSRLGVTPFIKDNTNWYRRDDIIDVLAVFVYKTLPLNDLSDLDSYYGESIYWLLEKELEGFEMTFFTTDEPITTSIFLMCFIKHAEVSEDFKSIVANKSLILKFDGK